MSSLSSIATRCLWGALALATSTEAWAQSTLSPSCADELRRAPESLGVTGASLSTTTVNGHEAYELSVPVKHGKARAWLRPLADAVHELSWTDRTREVDARDHGSWDFVYVRRDKGWEAAAAFPTGVPFGREGTAFGEVLTTAIASALDHCIEPEWATWTAMCRDKLDEAAVRATKLDPTIGHPELDDRGHALDLVYLKGAPCGRPSPSQRVRHPRSRRA